LKLPLFILLVLVLSESMPGGADRSATRLTFLALRSDSLPELFVPLEQMGDQTLEPKHLFFEE
jgi:hypothetical protein